VPLGSPWTSGLAGRGAHCRFTHRPGHAEGRAFESLQESPAQAGFFAASVSNAGTDRPSLVPNRRSPSDPRRAPSLSAIHSQWVARLRVAVEMSREQLKAVNPGYQEREVKECVDLARGAVPDQIEVIGDMEDKWEITRR
jgi:hypothetical protein